MSNGRQTQGQETQYLDPFGQFLINAYMKGMVPGSQTSAFNTVLDLLSPGAVAGRREMGPDLTAQYENMFGGTPLLPQEREQMLRQATGVQRTPQQQAVTQTDQLKALADYLGKIAETKVRGREAGAKEREVAVKEQQQPAEQARAEAQAKWYSAQATKAGRPSVQDQLAKMNMDLKSYAMWGRPYDAATGQAAPGAGDPQAQQTAQKLLGAQRKDPVGWTAIAAMINHDDVELNQLAMALLEQQAPGMFTVEDVSWFKGLFGKDLKLVPKRPTVEGTVPPTAPGAAPSAGVAPPAPGGGLKLSLEEASQMEAQIDALVAQGAITPQQANEAKALIHAQTQR